MSGKRDHAIVIGASIAGLMAARVLSDHYQSVTVVERDKLPDEPAPRNGAPQSRHTHVLLVRGRQIIEEYFPGIVEELTADGATLFDSAADIRLLTPLGWLPRFKTGFMTLACTRGLLEWRLRKRLAQRENVGFLEEAEVSGLLAADQSHRVAGVTWRPHPLTSEGPHQLPADLVADAGGRDSHAPKWLETLGRVPPAVRIVNSYVGYATRVFARPAGERDWVLVTIQAQPPAGTRAGVILPIEGDRWIVTLVGYIRDYPPLDERGFMDFARSLPDPILYEALRDAVPLTPIAGYRRTENYLHLYEAVADWPAGFVVTGDAVSGFNPAYGQGMTNAAIGATILDAVLQRNKPDFEAEFQRRLAAHNKTPWLLATNEDFRFPGTEGERPRAGTWLTQRYLDRLFIASVEDQDVFEAFISVAHLLKGPGYLFRPRIAAKVLWHTLTHLRPPSSPTSRP
jgi:2-polyprenyl-6-methoxyphenol hydroxylase-like FAD-dependent oxidoreductase